MIVGYRIERSMNYISSQLNNMALRIIPEDVIRTVHAVIDAKYSAARLTRSTTVACFCSWTSCANIGADNKQIEKTIFFMFL